MCFVHLWTIPINNVILEPWMSYLCHYVVNVLTGDINPTLTVTLPFISSTWIDSTWGTTDVTNILKDPQSSVDQVSRVKDPLGTLRISSLGMCRHLTFCPSICFFKAYNDWLGKHYTLANGKASPAAASSEKEPPGFVSVSCAFMEWSCAQTKRQVQIVQEGWKNVEKAPTPRVSSYDTIRVR